MLYFVVRHQSVTERFHNEAEHHDQSARLDDRHRNRVLGPRGPLLVHLHRGAAGPEGRSDPRWEKGGVRSARRRWDFQPHRLRRQRQGAPQEALGRSHRNHRQRGGNREDHRRGRQDLGR